METTQKGLTFKRFFTKEGKHPFENINWIKVTAQINDKDGRVIFKQEDVEFPDFWSQTSIDITVEKYFAGALGSKNRETSLKQPIIGIVSWYKECGKKDGYFASDKDAEIFADELAYLLVNQYSSFASPIWFNVRNQKDPQVAACFILGAEDTMDSISENMKIEMDIFRRGSGVGTNHSNLRSTYESVGAGGTAMGPIKPMEISDRIAGATKSGGKTRRAAIMKELDIDHGNIEKFITQKSDIEEAAKILVKYGKWSAEFEGPDSVYNILALQNFNESVSIFNVFKEVLKKNDWWALIARNPEKRLLIESIEGRKTDQGQFVKDKEGNWFLFIEVEKEGGLFEIIYFKVIKWRLARDLWNDICNSSWICGDPALQFIDTINKWHTCKKDGRIRGSNPCSEYLFLDDTSCNLASHNILKFIDEKGNFLIDAFIKATQLHITAMDISINNASYPTKKIGIKTKQYRTLGLGYANIGALLLIKKLPYDSEEGRNYAASITALLLAASYNQSAKIADQLGPFERYEYNKESVKEVLDLHIEEINKLLHKVSFDITKNIESSKIIEKASFLFPSSDVHIRNAQTVVIAPTGTIGLQMDCDTTAIEPLIGLVTYKKMVGGGFLKLVPKCIEKMIDNLGYTIDQKKIILTTIENNPDDLVSLNIILPEHLPLFATSFSKAIPISPEAHVDMVAAIQPFLSGGCSKTVNLPEDATEEDFSRIFLRAWEKGVKCVAPYRDNSKGSQPLGVKKDISETNGRPIPIRKRLPDKGSAHRHKFEIGGQKGFLHFGFYPDSNKLGDMFAEISKGGSTLNGLMNTIAISVSMMLQYGIPPEEIIDAYKELQFEPSGMTSNKDIKFASSIPDYIAKYIENLINKDKPDQKKIKINTTKDLSGPLCTNCHNLTYKQGTCYLCPNCGQTTGCS